MPLPNLRSIFAGARSSEEEIALSRTTFYKFAAFVGSCVIISLLASHNHAPPSKDLKAIRGLVNAALEEGFKLV